MKSTAAASVFRADCGGFVFSLPALTCKYLQTRLKAKIMLRRAHRLDSTGFERAFNRSRSFRSGPLSVRVHWRDDDNFAHAAFVVPKKLGKATWRNRVRRRLRAAITPETRCKYLQRELCGSDLIFFASKDIETLPMPQLEANLSALLERVAREKRSEKSGRDESRKSN